MTPLTTSPWSARTASSAATSATPRGAGADARVKATYYDEDQHGHGCNDRNAQPKLKLSLYNDAKRSVTFTITFNNYSARARQTVRVNGRDREAWVLDACGDADGWYDLTITVSSDSSWSQRLTGHLETGRARSAVECRLRGSGRLSAGPIPNPFRLRFRRYLSSQPVLVAEPRIAWTAYTLPPYILNMCMSVLPMKKSKPTPMPVSASEKTAWDLITLPVGSPD